MRSGALIIVLTYSRHSFVWPTFSQKLVDVIEGLEAAWAFFEDVPNVNAGLDLTHYRRVSIDPPLAVISCFGFPPMMD